MENPNEPKFVVNDNNEIIASYSTLAEAVTVANELNAYARRYKIKNDWHYRGVTSDEISDEMLSDYMLRKYAAMTR